MNRKEYVALRDQCLNLVTEKHIQQYGHEMLTEVTDLTVRHKLLPAAELVINTYKGILGYMNWLIVNGRDTSSFLRDAMHDLAGSVQYNRNDGFTPRTSAYIEFYKS